MCVTVKTMLEAAEAEVPRISGEEARRMVAEEDALLLDVRDAAEVARTGKAAGALNVSRGMIEFRADEQCRYYDPVFVPERPMILYCASGGRSALAGKTLKTMGYRRVCNAGTFDAWAAGGGEVEGVPAPVRKI